ncbi:MAG: hypothetical protein HKN23_20110 [Verrucomicrobiales bacterium]|nr:hypothetical protein [Verrucomicrobiales bacterium]
MKGLFYKLTLGILTVVAGHMQAQINVDFKVERTAFISHEPVVGQLTIKNNAGQDLIMAGKNGGEWLEFRITDGNGRTVPPTQGIEKRKPIVIGAGKTYKANVTVNRNYPLGSSGVYRITALVNFPQINRVFSPPRPVTVNISEGVKMWSQVFGVPVGRENAGAYREYSILTQHFGARQKTLYFRLADADNGLVRKTYPIGDYLMVRPPKYVVDAKNQLHVFHMAGPKSYVYTIIDVDGKALDQQVYVNKGTSIPDMVTNGANEVAVIGGMTLAESRETYENREFRNASERPPGLPQL